MHLNQPKLLIALIFEYLCKQGHLMILPQVRLNRINDTRRPLYNQRLQPILLVQVRVHELLHRLSRHLRLFALLVKLDFLSIHIENRVF